MQGLAISHINYLFVSASPPSLRHFVSSQVFSKAVSLKPFLTSLVEHPPSAMTSLLNSTPAQSQSQEHASHTRFTMSHCRRAVKGRTLHTMVRFEEHIDRHQISTSHILKTVTARREPSITKILESMKLSEITVVFLNVDGCILENI